MKLKQTIAVLATSLITALPLTASADQLTPVVFGGTSFSNLEIGNISITSPSDLLGSVFAATEVGTNWGTFKLSNVTFSSASVGSLIDLDSSAAGFSFKNVAAGVYTVLASGSLTQTEGAIPSGGFVGARYTVSAVPEPESYAMFLAGLGLMGAIARRRRTK